MGVRTVFQDRVGRLLGKGFELQLGPELLRFESEDEFKSFLKNRSNAAAESLAKLKGLSGDKLERQLRRNERIYKHVLGLLLQVVEHDTPVDMLWRELDISELPDEQQWPAILFAVSSNDVLSDALKRESIERFIEFLRARKTLILRLIEFSNENAPVYQQTAEFDNEVDMSPPVDDEPQDVTGAAMTVGRNYRRMPEGELLTLDIDEDEQINLYLSRWKISLHVRAGSVFVEENGQSVPLQQGENSIGRSSVCKVALTSAPLDVSRKHLIIDWVDGKRLVLRDVSKKGTWISEEHLRRAQRPEAITGE